MHWSTFTGLGVALFVEFDEDNQVASDDDCEYDHRHDVDSVWFEYFSVPSHDLVASCGETRDLVHEVVE